jgi:hypothetical protein
VDDEADLAVTPVAVSLDDEERELLRTGLVEWLGPARPTEELAVALGFDSVQHLFADVSRLRRAIANAEPLTALDWTRAIAATEISFVSDVFGSGYEWRTTTGRADAETLAVLRRLQRKLVALYGPAVGTVLGRRPAPSPPGAQPYGPGGEYWDSLT